MISACWIELHKAYEPFQLTLIQPLKPTQTLTTLRVRSIDPILSIPK